MQNSDIRGQRYLNDKTRRATQEMKDRDEFLEELRRIREGAVPVKDED
jgi:hypothetical protein